VLVSSTDDQMASPHADAETSGRLTGFEQLF
jgi:hypothetical protein